MTEAASTLPAPQPRNLLPADIKGFESVAELALDLRWSWNHATDTVWRQLDSPLWELTHNPWVVLQTVSRDKIDRVLADPSFRTTVDGLVQTRRHIAKPTRVDGQSLAHHELHTEVGGDQLKAAGDLGLPIVGVGLLYQQGYFRQLIDKDGNQQPCFRTTIRGSCQ
jgi:starch phosphorylase